MREFKGSTKAGQKIIAMGSHYDGFDLRQVYGRYSDAKERAWNWCYEQYLATDDHDSFSICSHNTFGFTVSWLGKVDGEDIMRVETKDNSYMVWFNR